jgi:DNA-binding beta-propeller fold protein YncE
MKLTYLLTFLCLALPSVLPAAFEHAEARHTHPIGLTPDGSRLLVVDSVNASLAVFDVTAPGVPVRIASIPTGLEPVSVRARTDDEVWVVNELSDSISIISLGQGVVLATLSAVDEPADVAFAQGKAFVTCARNNRLLVFNATTRSLITTVPLEGLYPRAITTSADGSKVYVAFFESGNGSTILPKSAAPAQPAPSNPALPAPPQTALIVPANDPRVSHTTLDHDVVGIDATSHSILGYASGVGTNLFDLVSRPVSGDLWVGNMEALNLIRFEPNLRGRFAKNQVTRIAAGTGQVTAFDLNPGIDYETLPNPSAQATALAQPASLVFSADGSSLWVAAFASDRIARLDPEDGSVLERLDLRTGDDVSSASMRGPRGLALDEAGQRLFVLNKLSHTLSVVATDTLAVTHEIPVSTYDPTPAEVKSGRGYLFDARLSGNGTVSCGTCHFDADRDGLAWDLGDPGGEMMTVLGANLSIHDNTPRPRVMHPMKGPMATQTLRGMQDGAPFHWRGDRPTLADFNPTFDLLMGGAEIDDDDMADLSAYLLGIVLHPNPNRNKDRSLPTSFGNGNPVTGRNLYNNHNKSHCAVCHVLPKGSDNNIDLPQEVGSSQPLKTPPLRTVYQRLAYNPRAGQESLTGFGMLHDGTGFLLPIVHPYVLDDLNLEELRHVTAFLHCFDTGVAPAVGISTTITTANRADSDVLATLTLLETQAKAADCDLVVRGLAGGVARRFLYNTVAQNYRTEAAASSLSRSALLTLLQTGDSLTFMGVLPGAGMRLSVDEDEDGLLNQDDPNPGYKDGPPRITVDLADRASPPGGSIILEIKAEGQGLEYFWFRGSQALTSVTGPVLTLNPATLADAGSYRVRVENGAGSVNSRTALVEIYAAPVITADPKPVTVKEGQKAVFSVTATGEKLTYQWRRGPNPVGGATGRELTLNEVSGADIGSYSVVVTNGAGSAASQPASLQVMLKPVITTLEFPGAIVGQNYQFQLTAESDPTRYNVSGLPPGLKCDAATGIISGRAKSGKVHTVKVSASNEAGTGQQISFEMLVEAFPPDLLGVFEGVVPPDEVLNTNLGGRIRLTLSKTGAISGKLDYGALAHSFKGVVDISPEEIPMAELTVSRKKADALELHLTFNRADRSVLVRLGPEMGGQTLTARLPASDVAAHDGGYTLALKAGDWAAGNPAGHGHGAFKTAKGKARGVLVLADGSKVTLAGAIGQGGYLPFRALLYQKTGVAQGTLKIAVDEDGRSLRASEVLWFKMAQSKFGRQYMDGFGPLEPTVVGGLYEIPSASDIALDLPKGSGNARLVFEVGGLPDPEVRVNLSALELQAGSPAKVLLPEANPGKVKLSVTPGKGTAFNAASTGLIKGSFELSDPGPNGKPLKRKAAFTGRIVRESGGQKALGFFILNELLEDGSDTPANKTPQLSGRVILEGMVP